MIIIEQVFILLSGVAEQYYGQEINIVAKKWIN